MALESHAKQTSRISPLCSRRTEYNTIIPSFYHNLSFLIRYYSFRGSRFQRISCNFRGGSRILGIRGGGTPYSQVHMEPEGLKPCGGTPKNLYVGGFRCDMLASTEGIRYSKGAPKIVASVAKRGACVPLRPLDTPLHFIIYFII